MPLLRLPLHHPCQRSPTTRLKCHAVPRLHPSVQPLPHPSDGKRVPTVLSPWLTKPSTALKLSVSTPGHSRHLRQPPLRCRAYMEKTHTTAQLLVTSVQPLPTNISVFPPVVTTPQTAPHRFHQSSPNSSKFVPLLTGPAWPGSPGWPH